MKILSDNLKYTDRFNIEIYLNEYKNNRSKDCGYFILSKDAKIVSDTFSAQGCFGIYTNEAFSLSGNAVTLKLPGINFPRTIISKIDAGLPGDLSYIDGCSNTILVPPGRNGEPCLNYLYFPENIKQTLHTHPSCRIGLVVKGNGYAEVNNEKILLQENNVFLLDRYTYHNFCTADSGMSILVFHPDSEDGPTDEFNPMKSRTYLK